LISTQNHGSAHARNLSINASNGDYLLFLDSDDQLSAAALRQIFESNLFELDCDAFRFGYRTNQGDVFESLDSLSPELLFRQRGFWRYIYKREFLLKNHIRFLPDITEAKGFYVLDDWYFLLQFLANTPRIQMFDIILYFYDNHEIDSSQSVSYIRQLALEHNSFDTLSKHLMLYPCNNSQFLVNSLFLRCVMIFDLIDPPPSLTSRTKLAYSFVSILHKLNLPLKGKLTLRTVILLARILYRKVFFLR
jgi:glycosyltransferase involved in cell wall biosynthesis